VHFHWQFAISVFFLFSCAVSVIDLKLLCQHINNEKFNNDNDDCDDENNNNNNNNE
jgi:hypothetical protein